MSVSSLEINEDRLIANGKEFGKTGQYREIIGIAKFSLDPKIINVLHQLKKNY